MLKLRSFCREWVLLMFFPLGVLLFVTCPVRTSYLPDLEYAYVQIKENHPGVYNEADPGFNEILECEYAKAKAIIGGASNAEIQKAAITAFGKSFNDGHCGVSWYKERSTAVEHHTLVEFTVRLIAPNVAWICIPSFALTKEEELVFNDFLKKLPALQGMRAIVFDVRGNRGGNSDYGMQVLGKVFGELYVENLLNQLHQQESVDWRVSGGNLAHLKLLQERYHLPWLATIVDGMANCLQEQVVYYTTKCGDAASSLSLKSANPPIKAKIFAIINRRNGSAALDFLDALRVVAPSVTFIGQETGADRLYMELRSVLLPSKHGEFFFPIKVYRGRVRGDNEPYMPDIEADVDDVAELEKIVLSTVLD